MSVAGAANMQIGKNPTRKKHQARRKGSCRSPGSCKAIREPKPRSRTNHTTLTMTAKKARKR